MNEPEQPDKTFQVKVFARGLNAQFTLPDEHLNELLSWLAERAAQAQRGEGAA